MSSTSSSDCECDEYCHYATGFYENYGNTVNRTPFYPTMGHPLIYYAQTPRPGNRRQSRKRDQNCFVKAFKWYTQERCNRNESNSRPKDTEFASWLDMKYDEFLGTKLDKENNYKLTIKQTSVITAQKLGPNVCGNSCNNNFKTKFKRLKSPWNKKRRARSNKESSDIEKGNQSCQFILQPKDLTRPNSECCQSSLITVTTASSKKTGKSQSLTNLCQDRILNEPIEVIPTQEGTQLKKDFLYKRDSSLNKKSASLTKNDVSCQCSIGNINKVDAETQYEDVSAEKNRSPSDLNDLKRNPSTKSSQSLKVASQASLSPKTRTVSCECGPNEVICEYSNFYKPATKSKTPSVDTATQYEPQGFHRICNCASYQGVEVPKPPPRKCPCEMDMEEFMVPVIISPLKRSEIGAQTSDRCITFEKGSPYNYPLFMKIMCADKLIEENSK